VTSESEQLLFCGGGLFVGSNLCSIFCRAIPGINAEPGSGASKAIRVSVGRRMIWDQPSK